MLLSSNTHFNASYVLMWNLVLNLVILANMEITIAYLASYMV